MTAPFAALFLDVAAPSRWQALGPFLREYWLMLLVPLVGFVAVYFLLPQARRSKPLWLGFAGILALLLGVALLIHFERTWPETVLFYSFSLLAVAGAVLLVTQSNPVYAALSFALVVLSSCGLFLLQAAPFLMAATIIIYAGAIVVTFLFVIMLAQQVGSSSADLRSREPFLACLAGFVLLGALLCVLARTYDRPDLQELDVLAGRLQRLAVVKTPDEAFVLVGVDPKRPGDTQTLEIVDRLGDYLPKDVVHANIEADVSALRDDPARLPALRRNAAAVLAQLREHYRPYGLGGPPRGWEADVAVVRPALPARNVEAMGQTLFTDYLVPVELAAVLLLVATIGAIAIAGRRAEELR